MPRGLRDDQIEAVSALLRFVESVNPQDDWWAEQMRTVYEMLCDEVESKSAERATVRGVAKARQMGVTDIDRRALRKEYLELAKQERIPYPEFRYMTRSVKGER